MKKIISILLSLTVVLVVVTYNSGSPSPSFLVSVNEFEEQEFIKFMQKYQKSYSASEYINRFQIFKDNLSFYKIANQQGNSHTVGINEFSDMTVSEFSSKYFTEKERRPSASPKPLSNYEYPPSIDWRSKGAVTPVKNQSPCACGWAFASAGVVEGSMAVAGKGLNSLSSQELLDCSDYYGNNGCNGGYITNSLSYILAKGLTSEGHYPYTGNPKVCDTAAAADIVGRITVYNHIQQNDYEALLSAVARNPVAVEVLANSWFGYTGGVLNTPCSTTRYNYSALVVGYNTQANPPYYIVKPSFGTGFGKEGYIYLQITGGAGSCCVQGEPTQAIS